MTFALALALSRGLLRDSEVYLEFEAGELCPGESVRPGDEGDDVDSVGQLGEGLQVQQ